VLVDFMELLNWEMKYHNYCLSRNLIICAGAERWDYAAALRKAMLDAGIHKVSAHSFI